MFLISNVYFQITHVHIYINKAALLLINSSNLIMWNSIYGLLLFITQKIKKNSKGKQIWSKSVARDYSFLILNFHCTKTCMRN